MFFDKTVKNHLIYGRIKNNFKMKKKQEIEKKLSLKKLQMVKIRNGMNTIKGGGDTGDINDTINDNTDNGGNSPKTVQTSLDFANRVLVN